MVYSPSDYECHYTYNNNGNLTYQSKTELNKPDEYLDFSEYGYNVWGQLTSYRDMKGSSASYSYYADGTRRSKTVADTTYGYYYSGQYVVNETKKVGTNTAEEYASNVIGVGGIVGRYGTQTGWFMKDAHGDVLGAYGSNGTTKLADYTYDAWGNQTNESYSWWADENPVRYAGEYYDTESGLIYLRARYYDSGMGRFVSEDPIKDGLNWYAYCSNDPINKVDPSGLKDTYEGYTAKELLELLNNERQKYAAQLENDPNNTQELAIIRCRAGFIRSAIKSTAEYTGGNDIHIKFRDMVDKAFDNPDGQTDEQMSQLLKQASSFLENEGMEFELATTNASRGLTRSFINKTLTETICFVGNTLIYTDEGYEEIQNIKVGDFVYSRNEFTGEQGFKAVTNIFENETNVLFKIKINNEFVETTASHPFWVLDKGWIPAKQLCLGQKLVDKSNNIAVVSSIQKVIYEKPIKVYNFEVKEWHTYFVGQSSLFVHNTCKMFSGDQQAVIDLGRYYKGLGSISYGEALILQSFAVEYGIKNIHIDSGHSSGTWTMPHINVFNMHIEIDDYPY